MLTADALCKRYGTREALRGVSLSVGEGQILGLLGRNGAGKSTLLNLLTGYLRPTSGTVELNGLAIADDPRGFRARIGYLPETPPLYADMTVAESLRFAARIKGVPKREQAMQIAHVMEAADVATHAARLVRHLSKGYRQRVGLAQAMLGSPDVLILDEPSVGLDPTQIAHLRNAIRTYAQGRAVIVSSHILPELADLCTHALVLDDGCAVLQSDMNTLLTDGGALDVRVTEHADIPGALRALPGVVRAETRPCEEQGCMELRLYAKPGADLRAAVFQTVSALGGTLLLLKPGRTALEDVFERAARHESGIV